MPAPPIETKVRGLRELERGARNLFDDIEDDAEAKLLHVADQTATIVRAKVPVRSGRLASSVDAGPAPDGADLSIGAGVPYAGWIEFGGTRGRPYVPAGRYLFPTAKDAADDAGRAGERAAREQIRSARWPKPKPW
jgi:hypothetical protein